VEGLGGAVSSTVGQDAAVAHWVTPVAGFPCGDYQKLELDSGKDDKFSYKIGGYYLRELPDSLAECSAPKTMAPRQFRERLLHCEFGHTTIRINLRTA
jgi:hypothetical protein